MHIMDEVKYLPIDAKKLQASYPQYAMLISYMFQTGRKEADAFHLPHSSADFVLETLRKTGHIYYQEPSSRLLFSEDTKGPAIKVTRRNENEALIEVEPGYEIIQGRLSGYAIYDDVLYRLPRDFPFSFYRVINGKNAVLDYRHIPEQLHSGYIPGVTSVNIKKEEKKDKKIRPLHIKSQAVVSVGLDGQSAYIKPVIAYGKYLEAVAGGEYKAGNHYVVTIEDEKYVIERDEIREILLRNYLNKYSYYFDFDEDRYIGRREDSIRVLKESLLPGLDKDCRIIYHDGLENLRIQKGKVEISANARFNNDNGLFELDLEFHCGNLKLTMDDLLVLAEKGRKYLRHGLICTEIENREEIERLLSAAGQNVLKSYPHGKEKLSLSLEPVKAIGFEQALSKCQHVEMNTDSIFADFMQSAKEKKPVQETDISPELRKILRHYQISGVNWLMFLVRYGLGGILADDMGLGKTLQILALLQSRRGQGTSLVICPKTLIDNWHEEIIKFTPEIKVLIPEGSAAQRKMQTASLTEYDLVITSYPLLRNDLENYSGFRFRYCILDEAQYIKNPDSETAKSVKAITADTRLALTGTPMENSILELWSVFDYLMPGFLSGRKEFNVQFADNAGLLQEKIKPFLLRRTKAEMLPELPPKIEQVLYTTMDREQLGIYMAVLDSVRKSVLDIVDKKSFDKSRLQVLAALMKLRQICNHPGLVNEEYLKHKGVSAKLELFEELINESAESGHKVLVFSQFTSMLKILAEVLDENNIPYSYLDGSTQRRGEIIRNFSCDSQIKVFLISLKAGGYGLNLTAADTVMLFDPWWNPMAEEQAIDRVYRMGQNNPVNVYRFVTRGTVEEKILALQQKKRALFDAVIGENNDFIEALSWEDIRQVLMQ